LSSFRRQERPRLWRFGKIHFEADHKVHVIQVTQDTLTLDTRFELDFNTAFEHPARPHGIAMK